MKEKSIQFRPALRFAWDIYKTNPVLYLKILFTLLGSWVVLEIIVISGQRLGGIFNITIHLLFLIIFSGLLGGFLKVSAHAWTDQQPQYASLFGRIPHSLEYFTAGLIYLFASLFGLVFYIFPGLFIATRYAFFGFVLMADGSYPLEALHKSSQLVNTQWGRMLGINLTLVALNLFGAALLGLGLFVTIPLSVLTLTGLYLQLEENQAPPGFENKMLSVS